MSKKVIKTKFEDQSYSRMVVPKSDKLNNRRMLPNKFDNAYQSVKIN